MTLGTSLGITLELTLQSSNGWSAVPDPVPASAARIAAASETAWRVAMRAYNRQQYRAAALEFQRFLKDFPADPRALEARLHLSRCWVELREPGRSTAFLIDVIDKTPSTDTRYQARQWLGRAYLDLGRYLDALAVASEIEADPRSPPVAPLEALLLRGQAQMGQGRDASARLTVASAESLVPKIKFVDSSQKRRIVGLTKSLALKLKTRTCAGLPSSKKLTDDQLIDQIRRRGDCLLDSLPAFREVLSLGDSGSATQSATELADSFFDYAIQCNREDASSGAKKSGKGGRFVSRIELPAEESKQNRLASSELSQILKEDCVKRQSQAKETLEKWREGTPDPNQRKSFTDAIRAVSRAMGRLTTRASQP